jgi:hypothetical protein
MQGGAATMNPRPTGVHRDQGRGTQMEHFALTQRIDEALEQYSGRDQDA